MRQIIPIDSPLLYTFSCLYQDIKRRNARVKDTILILAALVNKESLNILLADDDEDDQEIFTEAVKEIASYVNITIANNGQQLMTMLSKKDLVVPDIIFLDLNMPLKNGQECLEEIRQDERLKNIPVVIYSTSSEHIDETYKKGASFYIVKPDSFSDLKKIARKILSFDWDNHIRPLKESFVLNSKNIG